MIFFGSISLTQIILKYIIDQIIKKEINNMQNFYSPQSMLIEGEFIHLPDPDFFNLEAECWDEEDEDVYDDEEEYE